MKAVRRGLCLLAMFAGCNQIYGIDATHAVDAAYFDAPADAQPRCPGPGGVPRFARLVRQLVLEDCIDYTVSVDSPHALASCAPVAGYEISESELDADAMTLAQGFPSDTDMPRLLPEGDDAIARVSTTSGTSIGTFHREPTGIWSRGPDLPIPINLSDHLGTATRGPLRHLLVATSEIFHEFRSVGGGGWVEAAPYDPKPDVARPFGPRISADGLRLVFTGVPMSGGGKRAYLAQRADIMDPFGRPQPIPGVAGPDYIFLTEDCSRLYLSAILPCSTRRPSKR